ncbi:DUF2778 domain-containing protein [Caballeronia sp. LZ033]|uniref:tlde1 domain-containing protein n=1 Tax=Caballeronia sp. LZ033 TaxID=3038566 RepID=UPI002854D30A|nr:tlde1 domain-containing protein [Caballeronia sp. LZ033]MDR5813402.1 DUF2778 domain-containing protein [Caballeronia sp. LZ033]
MCARSGTLSLSFNGSALLVHAQRGRSYPAISGKPLIGGRFDFSPARYRTRSQGPIPPGRYWIQPSQMWTIKWYKAGLRSKWGNHRITIHIFPGTETFGRGGFFIHGGVYARTAGCIGLRSRMEDFVRDLKAATADSPECYIPLTVRY